MTSQLAPAQEIWKQIQPYSQRLSIAFAVFAIITIWFFNCMSPSHIIRMRRADKIASATAKDTPVLDPVEWKSFKLASTEKLSHNTARYVHHLCGREALMVDTDLLFLNPPTASVYPSVNISLFAPRSTERTSLGLTPLPLSMTIRDISTWS
jgi:hypothetical protein